MAEIVTPGEMVSPTPVFMENTYVQNGHTYAKIFGMLDQRGRGIVPLEGIWTPEPDDTVVGIISEVRNKVYIVSISYFGRCLLIPGKFDTYAFGVGDMIEARVKEVENRKTLIIDEAKLLEGGTIIEVKPKKVLRVIGKKSTMVNQISQISGTTIVVGLNGLIWLRGGNIKLATEAIYKVEREAHTSGLTDAIKRFLETRVK